MTLDRRALNISRFILVMLVLVSLRIIYWQMIRGDELRPVALNPVQAIADYRFIGDSSSEEKVEAGQLPGNLESLPQPVVQRTSDLLRTITRGNIFDRNGRLLATDLPSAEDGFFRFYSEPSLAHVLGYVSGSRTGVTGIELQYNTTLLGLDRIDAQVEQMLHKGITGSDLFLTIDSSVQRAAENALRDQSGAILVLDAYTGAIIAMANAPRFDPNRVLEMGYLSELTENCSTPICSAPFLNRATQGRYSPGSTWKTLALIAALDQNQVAPTTIFDFGEPLTGPNGPYYVYRVDGGIIPDPNHRERQLDLEMSYAKSANAAFARIGDEMPADRMIDYAGRFGFGAPGEYRYAFEFEFIPAQLANQVNSLYENNLLRAVTAIGQGEILTSPMNIGMLVLSVLNDGKLPLPYIVHSIQDPSGRIHTELANRRLLPDTMKPETAQQVRKMMITAVENGTGQRARIQGIIVGGKTGTAQVGEGQEPHSWFAGFAEDENQAVVVVVIIENGGEGSRTAAPIFNEVAMAALRHAGEPVDEIIPVPTPQPTEPPYSSEEASIPLQTPTPEAEQGLDTGPDEETTAEEPVPTEIPGVGNVPPPDIPRDPSKTDITAANPTCAEGREMPQATGQFIWPSPYQALSGGDFKEGHPGLDLSAPTGSPVYAADTGLVIFAGWSGLGYGNAILIDHGNGFRTLYAHLSQVSIFCGASVEKGKLIGLSGNTGNSSGPHLHFEVRVPGGYLDPLKVLPLP